MTELLHTGLLKTAEWADRANRSIAHAIRWLALAMVLITVAVVLLRYLFNTGAIPLQESVMYLHGALFLLGIPYGISRNTHVRVDLIYSRLNSRHRHYVDIAGHAVFLIPVALFILITSLPYVAASWRVLEGSAEVGGIPGIFLLKSLIPVMAVLLLLQGLSEILRKLLAPQGS